MIFSVWSGMVDRRDLTGAGVMAGAPPLYS